MDDETEFEAKKKRKGYKVRYHRMTPARELQEYLSRQKTIGLSFQYRFEVLLPKCDKEYEKKEDDLNDINDVKYMSLQGPITPICQFTLGTSR